MTSNAGPSTTTWINVRKENPEAFTVTKQAVEVELLIQDPATHCNHSNSFLFTVHNNALNLFLSLYS
jgi:hypothetical protein